MLLLSIVDKKVSIEYMVNQKINYSKYEATIKYLLSKMGSIEGKKKLNKLFYYIDFDYFELKDKSITGDFYQKWKMGPVPVSLSTVLDGMDCIKIDKKKALPHHENDTVVYSLNKSISEEDIVYLDRDEKKMIDRVIKNYGSMTGKNLEILSHSEAPYNAVDDRETIPYEYAYYRDTEDLDEPA
jgi:uncharacterized phage-associated protein